MRNDQFAYCKRLSETHFRQREMGNGMIQHLLFFILTLMTHQNLFSIEGLTILLSNYHAIILLT